MEEVNSSESDGDTHVYNKCEEKRDVLLSQCSAKSITKGRERSQDPSVSSESSSEESVVITGIPWTSRGKYAWKKRRRCQTTDAQLQATVAQVLGVSAMIDDVHHNNHLTNC